MIPPILPELLEPGNATGDNTVAHGGFFLLRPAIPPG
jgi:hypothetical protein